MPDALLRPVSHLGRGSGPVYGTPRALVSPVSGPSTCRDFCISAARYEASNVTGSMMYWAFRSHAARSSIDENTSLDSQALKVIGHPLGMNNCWQALEQD